MLPEVLTTLQPRPGQVVVDGTLGGGGHGCALLERILPGGFLWGCDQDGEALAAAEKKLAAIDGSAGCFATREMNFAGLGDWVPKGSCDGVLLDLGTSSHQLDTPERGFSFLRDGPLDMRMAKTGTLTAAEVVNHWAEDDLTRALREWGDEPEARRIARAIGKQRAMKPFETTQQLAEAIERVCPRAGRRTHPATRAFQVLRMIVNREVEALEQGLQATFQCLKPGGRLAVITFHSVEDRLVKSFMREQSRDYSLPCGQPDDPLLRRPCAPAAALITRRAVPPGLDEIAANPRARSAQLRALVRLPTTSPGTPHPNS